MLLDDRGCLTVHEGFGRRRVQLQEAGSASERVRYTGVPAWTEGNQVIFRAAERLRRWTQYASLCVKCRSTHRQRLERRMLVASWYQYYNTVSTCSFCVQGYFIPSVYMFPSPLARLSKEQVWAWRPLHLVRGGHSQDQGALRRHQEVSKLKWRPVSVLTTISALPDDLQSGGARSFRLPHVIRALSVQTPRVVAWGNDNDNDTFGKGRHMKLNLALRTRMGRS